MLKKSLLVLLFVSLILEIYQTVNAFLNSRWILNLLEIPDGPGARTLNHITGWFLLLVSILILVSLDWIRQNKRDGLVLCATLGAWWIGIGIGIYFASGITANLAIDSVKGLLLFTASVLALKRSEGSRPSRSGI